MYMQEYRSIRRFFLICRGRNPQRIAKIAYPCGLDPLEVRRIWLSSLLGGLQQRPQTFLIPYKVLKLHFVKLEVLFFSSRAQTEPCRGYRVLDEHPGSLLSLRMTIMVGEVCRSEPWITETVDTGSVDIFPCTYKIFHM